MSTDARLAAEAGWAAWSKARDRRHNESAPEVAAANEVADEARELAAQCPQFACAWAAHLSGLPVLPLLPDGSAGVGVEAATSPGDLIAWWRESPSSTPGVPCGPGGVLAAALDEDGTAWLWERAAVEGPGADPLDTWVRRTEVKSAGPIRSVSYSGDGDVYARALDVLRSQVPRTVAHASLWAWPSGWRLEPGSRVPRGATLLSVVPCDGAEVLIDGVRWRVQWSQGVGRLLPAPSWVLETFGRPERVA